MTWMLAPVAGQSFNLSSGGQYFANEQRVIIDVAPEDVAELRRVGCVPWVPPEGQPLYVVKAEPEPEKAEAPVDPVVQAIMHAQAEAEHAEHSETEVEHAE